MNHLVFLDARAGELEKILSGIKSMVMKDFDPAQSTAHPVRPGDALYFLRGKDECTLHVKATVIRVFPLMNDVDEDLSLTLKEMQPRLQLTEDQFNHWSTRKQVLLVEFNYAHKIPIVSIVLEKIKDRGSWIAFEDCSCITPLKVSHEL
ncbi:MAG: hypothetical protein JSV37_05750 [Anaerolineaceae bacterium]|nr:MAG: hypothetical protein JSV37_05750 [Anaerolineaceae bacterium]